MNENSNHKCPLCGKETKPGETFCDDCREMALNEYLEGEDGNEAEDTFVEDGGSESDNAAETKDQDAGVQQEPVSTAKNKKNILLFVVCIVLIIVVGVISTRIVKAGRQSKEIELAFWMGCSDQNTTLAYSKYLVRYPNGIFRDEAQSKIRNLRRYEDSVWQEVSRTNSTGRLYSFLTDYPNTPYKEYVRNRIDSLTWLAMAKENTAASYKTYLDNIAIGNYDGRHKEEAQKRYDHISRFVEVGDAELEQIKTNLRNYFRLQTAKRYNEINKILAPKLDNFYGEEDRTSKEVIDQIRQEIKAKKISHLLYRTGIDSITVFRDSDSVYYTSFTLDKEITYTARNKKKETETDSITVRLDPGKRIKAIFRTQ